MRLRAVILVVGLFMAALIAGDVILGLQLASKDQQQAATQQQVASLADQLTRAASAVTTVDRNQAANAQQILSGLSGLSSQLHRTTFSCIASGPFSNPGMTCTVTSP